MLVVKVSWEKHNSSQLNANQQKSVVLIWISRQPEASALQWSLRSKWKWQPANSMLVKKTITTCWSVTSSRRGNPHGFGVRLLSVPEWKASKWSTAVYITKVLHCKSCIFCSSLVTWLLSLTVPRVAAGGDTITKSNATSIMLHNSEGWPAQRGVTSKQGGSGAQWFVIKTGTRGLGKQAWPWILISRPSSVCCTKQISLSPFSFQKFVMISFWPQLKKWWWTSCLIWLAGSVLALDEMTTF